MTACLEENGRAEFKSDMTSDFKTGTRQNRQKAVSNGENLHIVREIDVAKSNFQ